MTTNRSDRARSEQRRAGKSSRRREEPFQGNVEPGDTQKWFGFEVKILYILLGLSVIISVLLYPNILTSPVTFKLGDVADRDIKASREFLVEDDTLTEKNRQDSVKAVLSVYDFDRTAAGIESRIDAAFDAGRAFLAESKGSSQSPQTDSVADQGVIEDHASDLESFQSHFFEILDIPQDRAIFDVFMKNGFAVG